MSTKLFQPPINLAGRQSSITTPWSPEHILTLNSNTSFRLATLKGSFIWHSHPDTDEVFYCVSGTSFNMEIATDPVSKHEKDGFTAIELKKGDMFCVPQGVRHRPVAEKGDVGVLIIEKSGTVNTGDEKDSEEGKARTKLVDESGN